MNYKHLFSTSLNAAPARLHFAAHSHHLWPDSAFEGHQAAARAAATLADHKWDEVLDKVVPAAHAHIAGELGLPDPETIATAPNTHEFIVRMASCFPQDRPLQILTTDGEFHSLSRQLSRWEEVGRVEVVRIPTAPFDSFETRFLEAIKQRSYDWVIFSHVFFGSGHVMAGLSDVAALLADRPDWLIVDGYHSFMALENDLSEIAERAFFLAGGYKYAMSGEGACFLHAPSRYTQHPANTGWYAAFGRLSAAQEGRVPFAAGGARFSGATFDPSGWYRFVANREMLGREGLTTAKINGHIRPLQDQFLLSWDQRKVGKLSDAQLLADPQNSSRARFLAFRHDGAGRWTTALAEAGVVVDARGDVIRFGFGLYQDHSDVERLIEICARTLTH